MFEPGKPTSCFSILVTGCPPLTIPAGAHKHVDSTRAVVKCNSTGETWFLTCGDKGWIGEIGNCSIGN